MVYSTFNPCSILSVNHEILAIENMIFEISNNDWLLKYLSLHVFDVRLL